MSIVNSSNPSETARSLESARAAGLVHEQVARRAAENPGALAVCSSREDLSYGELNRRANQLAHHLRTLGVDRNQLVGIYLERSPQFAIAALAVLKAGGAYIPLDPIHPARRLAFMLKDSAARVVVSTSKLMSGFPAGEWQTVTVDTDAAQIAKRPEADPQVAVETSDLAYMIYTSGSTGEPKGVELVHAGLANLVAWHHRAFQVTAADRASAQATVGFDASVWELWAYLSAGASLHLPEDSIRTDAVAMRDWIVARRITISFVATAIAERMLHLEWPASTSLRYLLTGADTLKAYPPAGLPFAFVNNYGPTECTVVTTSGLVGPKSSGDRAPVPTIGMPIDGLEVYILDENRRKVSDGEAGELFVAGIGLARGYRNRADLTAEKFVANPFVSGARMYKTGDLARRLPNGEIAFLGRIDEQVKVRGYRVEPSEISIVLDQHPGVETSAIVATGASSADTQLTAYLVLASGQTVTAGALRDFLRQRLPDYMVPASFVTIPRLPITEQGKVNRAALAGLGGIRLSDEAYVAPRTVVEEELVKILQPLLKMERVGVNDNFFLLGGHSLLGTQLIARIGETFGVDLTLLKLFDHPTVAEMAQEIEALILAKVEDADGVHNARV